MTLRIICDRCGFEDDSWQGFHEKKFSVTKIIEDPVDPGKKRYQAKLFHLCGECQNLLVTKRNECDSEFIGFKCTGITEFKG